jgi:hypothetical protein
MKETSGQRHDALLDLLEIAIVVSDLGWNQQQRIVLVLCLGFGIAGITGVTGAIIINNLHGINMLTQFNSVPGHHHFRH